MPILPSPQCDVHISPARTPLADPRILLQEAKDTKEPWWLHTKCSTKTQKSLLKSFVSVTQSSCRCCLPLGQPPRMATRLVAFVLLLASAQLSHAVHFTNQNWTIAQSQPFLLQWEYEYGEPNFTTFWDVVVWLTPNKSPLQPSNNLFHGI